MALIARGTPPPVPQEDGTETLPAPVIPAQARPAAETPDAAPTRAEQRAEEQAERRAAERPEGAGARDPLLDGLRAAALVRVILWHAVAAAWLTWIFPAMPVMFFIAGSLAIRTTQKGWKGLGKRAKRVLVPFWVYGVALAAAALYTTGSLGVKLGFLTWLLPLADPAAAGPVGEWLTSHLWYLRAYLWLLLLAPFLAQAAKRPGLAAAASIAGLAWLELGGMLGLPELTGTTRIAVGDLLCYGLFAVLGVAWARTRRDATGPAKGGIGLVAAGAATVAGAYGLGQYLSHDGDLNSSYLLLTISGLGWLLMIGGAQHPLRWVARRGEKVTQWISARAVTIYLWHPAAILTANELIGDDSVAGTAAKVGAAFLLTFAAAVLLGWIEDVAAGRAPALWPGTTNEGSSAGRLAAATTAAVVAGALVVATSLTGSSGNDREAAPVGIPVPSDRTALADSAFAPTTDAPVTQIPLGDLPAAELQQALEGWAAAHPEFDEITASVVTGDATWTGNSNTGYLADGGETVGLRSLSKSITAALLVQEAAAGRLDLDAQMPDLPGVAEPETPITPRQLMRHTSGLGRYVEADGYDDTRYYTPAELVNLVTGEALRTEPGSEVFYSNAGYLWLGLLLEETTGKGYAELVAERIAAAHSLPSIEYREESGPGRIGFASGGLYGSPADIAKWYDLVVNTEKVFTAEQQAEVLDLQELGVGLGVWPLCPCGETDGKRWATGYGHVVGDSGVYSYPGEKVTVYVRLTPEGVPAMEAAPEVMDALRAALAQK